MIVFACTQAVLKRLINHKAHEGFTKNIKVFIVSVVEYHCPSWLYAYLSRGITKIGYLLKTGKPAALGTGWRAFVSQL